MITIVEDEKCQNFETVNDKQIKTTKFSEPPLTTVISDSLKTLTETVEYTTKSTVCAKKKTTLKKKGFKGERYSEHIVNKTFQKSNLDNKIMDSGQQIIIKHVTTDIDDCEVTEGWLYKNNHRVRITYCVGKSDIQFFIMLHHLMERGFPMNGERVTQYLHRSTLDNLIAKSTHDIQLTIIITDTENTSPLDLDGPWTYYDSSKVVICYIIDQKVNQMRLDNLVNRGSFSLPDDIEESFGYYSYLRLKLFLPNRQPSLPTYAQFLDTVSDDEFFAALRKIHEYYRKNRDCVEKEGLVQFMGPQNRADRKTAKVLYYGSNGFYRYYRFAHFTEGFNYLSFSHTQLHALLSNPTSLDIINEQTFEMMLKKTNRDITSNSRDTNKAKLKPFAGPQCSEDRVHKHKLHYGDNIGFNNTHRNPGETEAPQSNEISQLLVEKIDYCHFNIRQCMNCEKIRVLGERASTKYPLGYYVYNGQEFRIKFTCSNLFQVSCESTDNDLEILKSINDTRAILEGNKQILAYTKTEGVYAGYLLEILELNNDKARFKVLRPFGWPQYAAEKEALTHFGLEWLISRGDGFRFCNGTFKMCPDFKKVFKIGKVNCEPREAVNCTPFHDLHFNNFVENNNPSCQLKFEALNRVKECHSVLNNVVIFKCVKCTRECPTIESSKTITTRCGGEEVSLDNEHLLSIIDNCDALNKVNFRPSSEFQHSEVYERNGNSLKSICQDCMVYYKIENAKVCHVTVEPDSQSQSQGTSENCSQESIDFHRVESQPSFIKRNPFSKDNLCCTNLFVDSVLSDIPARFEALVRQMSLATKLVLTPVHMCISIHRTISTSIPRISGGNCAFFLSESVMTSKLPWCDFKSLPFVIIESDTDDPTKVLETRVDLAQVYQAFQFMSSKHNCPVLNRERSYNRLLDIGNGVTWCPKQFEALKSELITRDIITKDGERTQFQQPAGLRRVKEVDILRKKDEPFTITLFTNWLSGDGQIAQSVRNYIRSNETARELSLDAQIEHFWSETAEATAASIQVLIEEAASHSNPSPSYIASLSDELKLAATKHSVTITRLVNYLTKTKLMSGTNDPGSMSNTYLFAEELFITQTLCSNDIATNIVPKTQMSNDLAQDPETIISDNLQEHALERLQEHIDRRNPVNEWSDGFLQRCFPFIFLSGDFDPQQQRPEPITITKRWKYDFLNQISKLEATVHDHLFQAVITCLLKKLAAFDSCNLYLSSQLFKDFNCPTKENLQTDKVLRTNLSKEVLQFANQIPDSPAHWRSEKQNLIGCVRDGEYMDKESRPDKEHPYICSHFNTIGVPYKDAPYIQRLFHSADANPSSFERTLGAIANPLTVSWMGCLLNELNLKYLLPYVFNDITGDIIGHEFFYYSRNEHGDNSNPHWHTITLSGKLGKLVQRLENDLERKLESELLLLTEWSLEEKTKLKNNMKTKWCELQQEIKNFYKYTYTNWASYMTANKTKVSDFQLPQIASIDMVELIDNALSTGDFTELDNLYNCLAFFCQRHITHTGKNGNPGKKDYCARTRKEKVSTDAVPTGQVQVTIICKRRKPQPERPETSIFPDPHKPKYTQLSFPCNDGNFNGCNIFEVLLSMGNVDTKAIVPSTFARPPKFEFLDDERKVEMRFYISDGSPEPEYICKYSTKGPVPPKNDAQLLLEISGDLQDGEKFGKQDIRKMHVRLAMNQSMPVWQCSGINVGLPLQITNMKFTGISVNNKYHCLDKEKESTEIVKLRHIDKFDKRNEKDLVKYGRLTKEQKDVIPQSMSMHTFFDMFNPKMANGKLTISKRGVRANNGDLYTVGLRPHTSLQSFNPAKSTYWRTCRSMCLWHKKYDQIHAIDNQFEGNDEAAAKFWCEEFKTHFPGGKGLEKAFRGFFNKYDNQDNNQEDDDDNCEDEITKQFKKTLTVSCTHAEASEINKTNAASRKERKKTFQTRDEQIISRQGDIQVMEGDSDDLDPDAHILDELSRANIHFDDLQACFRNHLETPHLARNFERVHLELKNFVGEVKGLADPNAFELNDEQYLVKSIILDWVDKVNNNEPVEALRLVVIGVPGAGKTAAFQVTATELLDILNWEEDTRVATPTGGTAYNMGFKAKTMHKVFKIRVGRVGEAISEADQMINAIINLKKHLASGTLKLIMFDEVSMIDRTMLYAIHMRLKEAEIDLNEVGIVFFGDPAQNAPVCGLPFYSLQMLNENTSGPRKRCAPKSLLGIQAFRELFRMPKHNTVEGYSDLFLENITHNNPKCDEKDNKLLTYRRKAWDGNYLAVFLNKTNRSDGSYERKQYSKLTGSVRYGKWDEKKIAQFYSMIASPEECAQNSDFQARKTQLLAYHHFSEHEPDRTNVASANHRRLVDFAEKNNRGIIQFASENVPASAESVSASEFKAIPNKLYLAIGAPVMIIDNFRDLSGLYNGALGIFRGVYYDNSVIVIHKFELLQKMHLNEQFYSTTQVEHWESSNSTFPKVFVKGIKLMRLNTENVTEQSLAALNESTPFEAEFEYPNRPPYLPTYFAVEFPEYTGPNFFGNDETLSKLVLLYPTMRGAKSNEPGSRASSKSFRKNAPIELSFTKTAYKGIGDTHPYTEVCLRGMFHKPGLVTTGITRNKSPLDLNIPYNERFNCMDLKQQRLYDSVIEGQCFERQCRIKSAELVRRVLFERVVMRDHPSLRLGNEQFNKIADSIALVWREKGPLDLKTMTDEQYIDLISEADNSESRENYILVSDYLLKTDERFHLKKTPSISIKERREISQYISNKKPKKPIQPKATVSGTSKTPQNKTSRRKQNVPAPSVNNDAQLKSQPVQNQSKKMMKRKMHAELKNEVSSPPRKQSLIDGNKSTLAMPGFLNPNAHACYTNSILQLLFRIPEEILLRDLPNSLLPTNAEVNQLFTIDPDLQQQFEFGGRLLSQVMDTFHQYINRTSCNLSSHLIIDTLCSYKPQEFTKDVDCDAFRSLSEILETSMMGKQTSFSTFIKTVTTMYQCTCGELPTPKADPAAPYLPCYAGENYRGDKITWEDLFNISYPTVEVKPSLRCNCNKMVSATIQNDYRFGEYIIIQLTCFGNNSTYKQILNLALDNELDLTGYNNGHYRVVSVVFHKGFMLNGGHYITYTLADSGTHWFIYDDDKPVVTIAMTNILHCHCESQPYLVLLERM